MSFFNLRQNLEGQLITFLTFVLCYTSIFFFNFMSPHSKSIRNIVKYIITVHHLPCFVSNNRENLNFTSWGELDVDYPIGFESEFISFICLDRESTLATSINFVSRQFKCRNQFILLLSITLRSLQTFTWLSKVRTLHDIDASAQLVEALMIYRTFNQLNFCARPDGEKGR